MIFENLKIQTLKMDAKWLAAVLVITCDVVFSVIMIFSAYGEIRLQAAEKSSAVISPDTLGSCHVSCLVGGKTFDPGAVKCLSDLTLEHCKRLETEDVSLYCPTGAKPSKLVAKFSVRSCN